MITRLLELAGNLANEYKVRGRSVLINCPYLPQFHKLIEHLSNITLEQVGITSDNYKDYFKKDTTTYFNIIEEQDICIGVFCIGQGSSLDLHDHPDMLVVSKFLMGSVQYRSLDLVDRSMQVILPKLLYEEESVDVVGKKLEAVVRSDKIIKAGEINYLTPEKGNIHRFVALENTALLDILIPNYNEIDRFCNSYIEVPMQEEKKMEGREIIDLESDEDQCLDDAAVIFEKIMTSKQNKYGFYSNGAAKTQKPKPGEKTTLIYMPPPLDQHITLLPYRGEEFEYGTEKSDFSKESP